jgi:hypothetical protein
MSLIVMCAILSILLLLLLLLFCNVLYLGLGADCAVSAGKVKVARPAKDDFADAAVSHRTDVSSGPRSDRPRSLNVKKFIGLGAAAT